MWVKVLECIIKRLSNRSIQLFLIITKNSVCVGRMSWTETAVWRGSLNFSLTGLQSASPSLLYMLICRSSKTLSTYSVKVWSELSGTNCSYSCVLCCRYNCAGLKFGKVDIGRYGEVSKRFDILFLLFFEFYHFKKTCLQLMDFYFVRKNLKELWTCCLIWLCSVGTRCLRLHCPNSFPPSSCFREGRRWCGAHRWTRRVELCPGASLR